MNCPRCHAENGSNSQFCSNCGFALNAEQKSPSILSPRVYILLMSIRFLIAAFGLWLLDKILLNLSFVRTLRLPNFPMAIPELIGIVVSVLMVILIVSFTILVGRLWRTAFPKYPQVGTVIIGILYLVILSVLYEPLVRIFSRIFGRPDGATAVLVLQIIFVLAALVLAIWLAVLIYRALPLWLNNIRQAMLIEPAEELKINEK